MRDENVWKRGQAQFVKRADLPEGGSAIAAGRITNGIGNLTVAYQRSGLKEPDSGRSLQAIASNIANVARETNFFGAQANVRLPEPTIPGPGGGTRVADRRTNLKISETNAKKFMSEAYTRYRMFGVIRACVLMLRDFSMTGFRINVDESKDKTGEAARTYQAWRRLVGLDSVVAERFRDFWAVANSLVAPHYAKAAKSLKDGRLKRVPQRKFLRDRAMDIPKDQVGIDELLAVAGLSLDYADNVIPVAYEILPPYKTDIIGPHFAPSYQIDVGLNFAQALKGLTKKQRTRLVGYQPILGKTPKDGKIILDPGTVDHLGFDKTKYESFGRPFWWQSSFSAMRKEELMDADQIMARSGLQYLVTVTIGTDEFPAGPEDIEAVATLFLATGSAHTIFWNHTLKVEIHQPELELFGEEKYNPVTNAILEEMGIPVVLTGGPTPGNFAVSRINVKPTIQRIREAQNLTSREFLDQQFEAVQSAMGFTARATVAWDPSPLEELERWHQVLQQYIDRALVTRKEAVEFIRATGISPQSWDAFLAQSEKEQELISSGKLPVGKSPYQSGGDGDGTPTNRPPGDPAPKKIPDRKQRDDPGGDSTPAIPQAASYVCEPCVQKLVDEFDISALGPALEDEMMIYDEAPAKLDRCVQHVKAQLLAKWKKKNSGKTPSEKVMTRIETSAWAICNSSQKSTSSSEELVLAE